MTQPRPPVRAAECSGKDPHTASSAKRIAAQMRRRGAKVAEFKCTHCGAWHLGSHVKADQGRRSVLRAKGAA